MSEYNNINNNNRHLYYISFNGNIILFCIVKDVLTDKNDIINTKIKWTKKWAFKFN